MKRKIAKFVSDPNVTRIAVIVYDALIGALCMFGAVRWRYTFENFETIPSNIDTNAALIFTLSCIVVWSLTETPKAMWRFTALKDIKTIVQSVIIASSLTAILLFVFYNRAQDFPRSVPFIAGLLLIAILVISRLVIMFIRNGDVRAVFRNKDPQLSTAILVGSDTSLHDYLREVERRTSGPGYNVIGLIETHAGNRGRSIRGFPILGPLSDLKAIYKDLLRQLDEPPTIISTEPISDRLSSSSLIRHAAELGAPLVRVKGRKLEGLTRFEASDLIGRKVRSLDAEPLRRFLAGRRVLITGAGGSIGSEIASQVANYKPEHIMLLDSSETNVYQVDKRLAREHNQLGSKRIFWTPILANINDRERLQEIFAWAKPDVVLHAAAIKHVHLAELNPIEALNTNVLGTQNILDIAEANDVSSVTLISTDKAVEPTSFMGSSKRIAELLVMLSGQKRPKLSASAVRFGNVLASAGSVIPLFEDQIAAGGPVTVTHKDVNRYFMTTEEASSLVLQAAALNATQRSDLSSIYLLEMGDPVKIVKLARQLIRLRGLIPDRDIKIKYTKLGKGEKLSEDLISKSEELESTYVDGIMRITEPSLDINTLEPHIKSLLRELKARNHSGIEQALHDILPGFKTPTRQFPMPKNEKSATVIHMSKKKKST